MKVIDNGLLKRHEAKSVTWRYRNLNLLLLFIITTKCYGNLLKKNCHFQTNSTQNTAYDFVCFHIQCMSLQIQTQAGCYVMGDNLPAFLDINDIVFRQLRADIAKLQGTGSQGQQAGTTILLLI